MITTLLAALAAVAGLQVVVWAISVKRRDASIVDIVWGLGYVIVAWVVHLRLHHATDRRRLAVLDHTPDGRLDRGALQHVLLDQHLLFELGQLRAGLDEVAAHGT